MTLNLTMDEAARALHKSRRWLQDWLGQHPVDAHGRPFFSKLGRTKVFREADIARILDATMSAPCPSNLSRRVKTKARITRSAGHTSGSLWTEAQELLKSPSLKPNSPNSKERSNVVSIQKSQKSEILQPS